MTGLSMSERSTRLIHTMPVPRYATDPGAIVRDRNNPSRFALLLATIPSQEQALR